MNSKNDEVKGNGGGDEILGINPGRIPRVAPPLPTFLTDDEEELPTRMLGTLKSNRKRAGVVKHRENNKPKVEKKHKAKILGTAVVPIITKTGKELKVPMTIGRVNGTVKVIKNEPGKVEINIEQAKEVIKANRGYITYAAMELGVAFDTLKKVVDENDELKEIVRGERERDLDVGEDSLMTMVGGNTPSKLGSTIFLLKTRGKDRGYVENDKGKMPEGGIQINLINYKEEDIKGEVVVNGERTPINRSNE